MGEKNARYTCAIASTKKSFFDSEAIGASIAKEEGGAGKSNTGFYRECAARTNLAVAGGGSSEPSCGKKGFCARLQTGRAPILLRDLERLERAGARRTHFSRYCLSWLDRHGGRGNRWIQAV